MLTTDSVQYGLNLVTNSTLQKTAPFLLLWQSLFILLHSEALLKKLLHSEAGLNKITECTFCFAKNARKHPQFKHFDKLNPKTHNMKARNPHI